MAERCAASVDSLVVMTGRHRGASVSLRDGKAIVGGGDDSTVFLSDPSARDAALLLECDPKGRLLASCVSGECMLGRNKLAPEAKPRKVRPGQVLVVGDVSLRAGQPTRFSTPPFLDRALGAKSWISLAAVAVLALGVSGFIGMAGGFAKTDGATRVEQVKQAVVEPPAAAALTDLRVMLEQVALPRVRVALDQAGSHIVATGELSAAAEPVWQRIIEWYDAKYGASVMLESSVEVKTGGVVLPFDIVAVSTHPRARIVLHDGSDHGVGAVLPGGWTVEAIDAAVIRISRNGHVVPVRF